MDESEVKIGGIYVVNQYGHDIPVKIIHHSTLGGWVGLSLRTGNFIHIWTAEKLRTELVTDND